MKDEAKNIQARVASELPDMSSSPVAEKAKQYLLGIDNADFWTDHKPMSGMTMLRELIGGGLKIRGFGFSDLARMDQATGEITISSED